MKKTAAALTLGLALTLTPAQADAMVLDPRPSSPHYYCKLREAPRLCEPSLRRVICQTVVIRKTWICPRPFRRLR